MPLGFVIRDRRRLLALPSGQLEFHGSLTLKLPGPAARALSLSERRASGRLGPGGPTEPLPGLARTAPGKGRATGRAGGTFSANLGLGNHGFEPMRFEVSFQSLDVQLKC